MTGIHQRQHLHLSKLKGKQHEILMKWLISWVKDSVIMVFKMFNKSPYPPPILTYSYPKPPFKQREWFSNLSSPFKCPSISYFIQPQCAREWERSKTGSKFQSSPLNQVNKYTVSLNIGHGTTKFSLPQDFLTSFQSLKIMLFGPVIIGKSALMA